MFRRRDERPLDIGFIDMQRANTVPTRRVLAEIAMRPFGAFILDRLETVQIALDRNVIFGNLAHQSTYQFSARARRGNVEERPSAFLNPFQQASLAQQL